MDKKARRLKLITRLALGLSALSVLTSMIVALGFFFGSGVHTYMVLGYLAVTVGALDLFGLAVIMILGLEIIITGVYNATERLCRRINRGLARFGRGVAFIVTFRWIRKPKTEEKPEEK